MSDTQAPASTEAQAPETPVDVAEKEATELDAAEAELETKEEAKENEPKKEEKKKWSLKVDGKQVDLESEEDLVKHAQMGLSAQEKWQAAAQIQKEVQEFVSLLQKNPTEALTTMGFDVDKLAEDHIARRIEEMQKSPEQLEREKIQKELEQMKKEKEEMETKARDAEMARLQEQYAVQIENEITDALTTNNSLPKSPYVVKRIADMMLLALNNGHGEVSVADVLPIVEKDIKGEIQEMFSAMPEELVEAVIGKEVFNRVRKKRLSRVKAPTTASTIKSTGADLKAQEAEDKAKKKQTIKEFFRNI